MSFIPIVGPLISCVIDGTFVDMFNAIMAGDWATVGMCALAFVPGGKVLKSGSKVLTAFSKAEKVSALEKLSLKAGGKTYKPSQHFIEGTHLDDIARKTEAKNIDETISNIKGEWNSASYAGKTGEDLKYDKFKSSTLTFVLDPEHSEIVTIFPH